MQPNTRLPNKREYVARTIAQSLNDPDRLHLYLQYCKKYPLTLIFRALSEAKSFPQENIKKSRAALFFYLIKKYAHERNKNLGN